MQLKILGCRGPYAVKQGQATSGYLVKADGATLLFDLGSGALCRYLEAEQGALPSAVFLSHLHYDHMADMLVYGYALRGKKLAVYLPFDESPAFDALSKFDCFLLNRLGADARHTFGKTTVTPFSVVHPVPTFGFEVESGGKRLIYTGDTTYFDGLKNTVKGADFVLADCAFPYAGTPHMTQEEGLRLKTEAGVNLLATHLPPDFYQVVGGMNFAKEGETYEI